MGLVERGLVPAPVARVAAHALRWSLWALPAGTACCGPELDAALHSPRLDPEGAGAMPVRDPSAANVLVLGGPVPVARERELQAAFEAMPHPRYVIAIGACALSGAPFELARGGRVGPVRLPIDVHVPGCPPRPEAILQGLEQLRARIAAEPLADRWRRASSMVGPSADTGEACGARLHRGVEAVFERASWLQAAPLVARLDETGAVARPLAYARAVEVLAGIEVSPLVSWGRSLLTELAVLRHTTGWFAGLARRLGLEVVESMSWRAREHVVDAFEVLTGARVHADPIRPGAASVAATDESRQAVRVAVDAVWDWTRSLDRLLFDVDVVSEQLRGLGVLEHRAALGLGLLGPNARASAASLDASTGGPEGEVIGALATHPGGDAFARAWVRAQDARHAARSARRLADAVPAGPAVGGSSQRRIGAALEPLRPLAGCADGLARHPEGVVLCTVVADGGERPWRLRVHGPGVAARAAAQQVCDTEDLRGVRRALVEASFAPSDGDADR